MADCFSPVLVVSCAWLVTVFGYQATAALAWLPRPPPHSHALLAAEQVKHFWVVFMMHFQVCSDHPAYFDILIMFLV